MLVEETSNGCLALPSHASLRLWEDSLEALVDGRTRQGAAISYSTKARLLAGDLLAYRQERQPLLAAFLLQEDHAGKLSIRTLAGGARHMAWVKNSFLLDIGDRELLAQHFDWTHRIAEAVPTFTLDYPRDYGILAHVRDAVRKHVASI